MLTKVFGAPVNFRGRDGGWRAIDTSLEADGKGGHRIARAAFDLALPNSLGDGAPVRMAHGEHALSFELSGARRAVAEVKGAEAIYRSVLPGVDVHYVARSSGVKESLMLSEAAAGDHLEFGLQTGDLTPKLTKSGGIELRDGGGQQVFSVAAPFMRDAAGEVSREVVYRLRRGAAGWSLGVRPDRAWLQSLDRRFPVEIDPTVYVDPQVDCHIDSSTPATSLCGDDELEVGWDGTDDHRALLKFDVGSAVPKGAHVEEGYVALYATGSSTSANKPVSVYRATSDWTSQASWASADGTNAWSTAGGDFDARVWRTSWPGQNPTGSWGYWAIGELIQDWVDGDTPNRGVVIKDRDDQQIDNTLRFASSEHADENLRAHLAVTWSPRTGMERQFTFVEQELTDRLGLAVNVGNGNLVQNSDDLRIAGTGHDLAVSRYFNNRAKHPTMTTGRKWQMSVGGGVALLREGGGDRMLMGPTGSRHVFHIKPDGSFESPTGIDATLTVDGTGHVLTYHETEEAYRFNADGDLTAIDDRNGNSITFDYVSRGVLDGITDTQGRLVDATHDADGNLASLEDSTNRTWLYDYDQYDRLTTYTDSAGGITRYVYQGPDNLIEIEDPRGTVTKIAYDADQRVTSIKRGYNRSNGSYKAQTTFAYSGPTAPCGAGDLGKTVMTDPRQKQTTYCYDVELRVTKTVDPNGNVRTATYTANSDVATATAPGAAETEFGYDSLNNLTSEEKPAGETTSFEYASGSHPHLPTKTTSPQGTSTVLAYDAAGNTTTVSDGGSPTQVEAKLEYNGQAGGVCPDDPSTKPGTLRCAIDGEGNETRYGYDDAGNLTSITPELPLGETTITYDALSRVHTVEDGKGQTSTYTHDALDRVTDIDYGGGETVSFDYDANGNRTERIDAVHGTSTWAHDALNRRVEDDLPSGSTDYAWDAASNLTSMTDAGGAVTYRYDDANRLMDLREPGGSCTAPVSLCTTFDYTDRDQRERTTYPNGVEQTVTFDSSDKPTRVRAVDGTTVLTDFTYDYDEVSPPRNTELRQSVTDKDGHTTAYAYDFLERLTSAIERDSSDAIVDSRSYTYDLASNRTRQVVNGTTTSYGYNAANQLCWTYGGTSGTGCDLPPTGATTYGYNASGNTTTSSAGLEFDYDDRTETTSLIWPGGAPVISFGRADAGHHAPFSVGGTARHNTLLGLSREGSTSWTRDPDGALISQRAGDHHYYLTDGLGSVVALVGADGDVAKTYKYDPYGKVRSTTGTTTNPFQFAGQYRDGEGHIYKVGSRYYVAGLGRWAQIDPLDEAGALTEGNRYAYAGADPVNSDVIADGGDDGAAERSTDLVAEPDPEPDPDPEPEAPPLSETEVVPFNEATEFIYTGSDPMQTGVAPETIEPQRSAVIRGFVKLQSGDPVEGVQVSVPEHPEFGRTTTRPNGEFFLAVNGGATLAVRLEKTAYLPVDRQVDVPWQGYVWIEDALLTALDANATIVDLSSPIAPAQVARGSIETDSDGSRQATLIFPTGTSAEMVMSNGTELPLEELTVRATEYTVGENGREAMPAELPPSSGYTYAAEYSVDEAIAAGATEVRFSQPVANYTDNFLDFPVGMAVPTGYYDRHRGQWVAAPNGRVVRVHAESGNAVELDVTGSGSPATPAELQELGVTEAELGELAGLYEPGDTLWRVQMDHFTPWDHNWPYGPPPDAVEPAWRPGPPPPDESCTSEGSVIECENQVLGEDIPLTGSDHALHYRSDRVPGRKTFRTIRIPLVGSAVPSHLDRVELTVEVAGQRSVHTFQPAPNLEHSFVWDGLDSFGRRLNGSQKARITTAYVYDLVRYQTPAAYQSAFARLSGGLAVDRERTQVRLQQVVETTVGSYEPSPSELGGWTLSAHHRYDPVGRVLHLGDGTRRSAHNIGLVTKRVAGQFGGPGESTGDGGPATDATLAYPEDIAVGPDGSIYFPDSNNARIRKIDASGTVHTVAGTGEFRDYGDPAGDGGPATEAELEYVYGLDVGADGSVYFSELNRVRKIDPTGTITTVAGNEVDSNDPDFGGDDGPATEAHLNLADAVAAAPDGSLYIVDYHNDRVRHVGTDGNITTLAGTGQSGFSGDGGSASEAQLDAPEGVEVAPDGAVYIVDAGNDRVRRVGTDGIIDTVAGNGLSGDPSYGMPATQTPLNPGGIAVYGDGSLLISDYSRIHRVDADGIIRAFAGNPCYESCAQDTPDGALATRADLGCPVGLARGHVEDVYVTDVCRHSIRSLRPALPEFASGDIAIPSVDGQEIYKFNPSGLHMQTVDALTGEAVYSFSYDGSGKLSAIEDADGLVTTVERNGAGEPTAIIAPFGRRTDWGEDAAGYLRSLTNPDGEETLFSYGAGGLLTSLTTAEGHETTFEHDAVGRLTRDVDAVGGFKELTRIVGDDRVEVGLQTKLGRRSTYEFERLGNDTVRRTQIDPAGAERTLLAHKDGTAETAGSDGVTREMTITGDPRFGMQSPLMKSAGVETPGGRQMQVQATRTTTLADPLSPLSLTEQEDSVEVNGKASTTVFDAALSRFAFTSPEGRTSTATVDAQRRVVQTTVPEVTPVSYGRDSLGRVETITQGARTAGLAYDAQGRLASVTDALDRVRAFEYDGADRVVREVLPDLREISFDYDDDGNLVSVTPPSRPLHGFTHTPLGLTSGYTPPDLGSGPQPTVFSWSDDHELTGISKPGGRQIAFGYDTGGRLDTVTHSRGSTQFAYDPATGNPDSVTAPGGEQTAFDFDGFLPVGETVSGTVGGQIARTFDDDFQMTSESVNGAHSVGFNYDDDGLLVQAGNLALSRDVENGLLSGATLGQISTTVGRNAFGEPESVASLHGPDTVYGDDYQRDALGRITQKVERRGVDATTYDYTYDDGGRLETVTKDAQLAATYSYDANGNRVGVTRQGELPVVAQYDGQDRMTSYGAATFQYDASGQLESKTDGTEVTAYEYDDLGALMGVTLPDATEIDYVVDASGRRIAKKRDGQLEQGFLYGQGIAPLAEFNPNGTVKSRFVYATRFNVPDYMVRDAQTYRILTDQLGSPRAVVNVDTGVVAQEMDFDEFGRVMRDTTPGFQPFGFAGGLHDSDTGLTRFGARDYDAATGRWTAKDPVDFAGGDANLYGYVLGDPVNAVDPEGLFPDLTPQFVDDIWNSSRQAGQDAVEYWADVANNSRSSFARGLANLAGPLAALWNCENAATTAGTLAAGGVGGGVLGGVRYSIAYHSKPHPFRVVGRRHHIQLLRYIKGHKGSDRRVQLPLP